MGITTNFPYPTACPVWAMCVYVMMAHANKNPGEAAGAPIFASGSDR